MKQRILLLVCLCACLGGRVESRAEDQASVDEVQLDAILQSDDSRAEKDAACSQLKRMATAQSVPALAALLTDPELSHSARYVLESMPAPEAGKALRDALQQTQGSNQIGIISSLAARRDADAAPEIADLLRSSDAVTASAAALALGKIGGRTAVTALSAGFANSRGSLREAEADGLLRCANENLEGGDKDGAAKIFQSILDVDTNEPARVAALRGLILASGGEGLRMALDAINGSDRAKQGVALELAAKLSGGSATTESLARLLASASAPVQIALLQCLQQRGDPAAMPAVAALFDSGDTDVRCAALTASGDLGDGSVVLKLAEKAASANGEERNAARQALVDLRRGPVTEALANALDSAPPGVQLELMRAVGDRSDSAAAAKLLKLAESEDDGIRARAFQALGLVATQTEESTLVTLVVNGKSADARSEAAEALGFVCQHVEAKDGRCDVQALADAARHSTPDVRIVLLPICAELTEAPTRDALRAALADPQLEVRAAAMRALCDTRDGDLLPDLLQLTELRDNKKIRFLAVRGCVRLASQEDNVKLSTDEKLDVIEQIYRLPLETEEKRVALSGLGAIADKRALVMLMPIMDDATVQAEAVAAALQVANAISSERDPEAAAALKKVLTLSSPTEETRKAAQDALKSIQ